MNPLELAKLIRSQPEVTKAQAMAAFISLADAVDVGEAKAIAILSEIAGCACTCDDPEFMRRFIVWEVDNGPMMKGGAA